MFDVNKFVTKYTSGAETPKVLQAGMIATVVAALLLMLVAVGGIRDLRYAVKTIGRDAAPSIIFANKIKAQLASMDAAAANELLMKPDHAGDAVKLFEQRRKEVSDSLVGACQSITYGDAERIPLINMVEALGLYEEQVATARLLHQQGNSDRLTTYREATKIMHETLLPNADALEKANHDVMEKVYKQQRRGMIGWCGLMTLTGLVMLAVLTCSIVYCRNRFHWQRGTSNYGLIGGVVLSFVFMSFMVLKFIMVSSDLKLAKEDAFDSIHMLWQARAIAYDADGDESRFLLDPSTAAEDKHSFFTKMHQLATVPTGQTFDLLAVASEKDKLPAAFTGRLADELHNITFQGEKAAAIKCLRTLGLYCTIDAQIRQLEATGKHDQAVALCTGTQKGQADWAFDQFDNALGETLDINQQAFDQAIERGFRLESGYDWALPAVMLLIILSVFLGLRPRMQEYPV